MTVPASLPVTLAHASAEGHPGEGSCSQVGLATIRGHAGPRRGESKAWQGWDRRAQSGPDVDVALTPRERGETHERPGEPSRGGHYGNEDPVLAVALLRSPCMADTAKLPFFSGSLNPLGLL